MAHDTLQLCRPVYTFVTEYLGFAGFGDEGKVMALAALGRHSYLARFATSCAQRRTAACRRHELLLLETFGEVRPFRRKFYDVFGPPRAENEPLDDRHRAIALPCRP